MLTERHEIVASEVVDAAIKVHKCLGPGMLEKVYEACLCRELENRGLDYQRQLEVPIVYDGETLDDCFRLDILVENLVICEIKAGIEMHPVWNAQILSYLKMSSKRLGFIYNFGAPMMKEGVKRMVV